MLNKDSNAGTADDSSTPDEVTMSSQPIANADVGGSTNYVETILQGMAPMHPPRGTYKDVLYGLKSAMIFANNLPHGAALTSQLVDIANLIWDYENDRLKNEKRAEPGKPCPTCGNRISHFDIKR